jgi:hypothetical protein
VSSRNLKTVAACDRPSRAWSWASQQRLEASWLPSPFRKVREYPWLHLVGPNLAELEGIAADLRGEANEEVRKRLMTGIVTAFQESDAPDIASSLDAEPKEAIGLLQDALKQDTE